jgi:hypothetical protein
MIHLIACPWKGDVMLRIARIDWPDFGAPALPPVLTLPELEGRLSQLRGAMAERNLDVLAVYADREHSANSVV